MKDQRRKTNVLVLRRSSFVLRLQEGEKNESTIALDVDACRVGVACGLHPSGKQTDGGDLVTAERKPVLRGRRRCRAIYRHRCARDCARRVGGGWKRCARGSITHRARTAQFHLDSNVARHRWHTYDRRTRVQCGRDDERSCGRVCHHLAACGTSPHSDDGCTCHRDGDRAGAGCPHSHRAAQAASGADAYDGTAATCRADCHDGTTATTATTIAHLHLAASATSSKLQWYTEHFFVHGIGIRRFTGIQHYGYVRFNGDVELGRGHQCPIGRD